MEPKVVGFTQSQTQFLIVLTVFCLCSRATETSGRIFTTTQGCEHTAVPDNSILLVSHSSVLDCALRCLHLAGCLSVQLDLRDRTCALSNFSTAFGCGNLTSSGHIFHYEEPCLNGGYMKEDGVCRCVGGWIGSRCERLMSNCLEGVPYGHENGVFSLLPEGASSPVKVYCTNGGRTYMLRHNSRNLNMNQTWLKYRNGFGKPGFDSWLGLDTLHRITTQLRYRMLTYIQLYNNTSVRVQHLNFRVGNESTNYVMTYTHAYVNAANTLGDSLAAMNGQPFSTYDNDNDNDSTRNCAAEYGGGYWFNACGRCNPTGPLSDSTTGFRSGATHQLFWADDLGDLAGYRINQFLNNDGTW